MNEPAASAARDPRAKTVDPRGFVEMRFVRGGEDPGRNVMIYEVDIPLDVDLQALRRDLRDKGEKLDLQISIQHKNIFEAINRI